METVTRTWRDYSSLTKIYISLIVQKKKTKGKKETEIRLYSYERRSLNLKQSPIFFFFFFFSTVYRIFTEL